MRGIAIALIARGPMIAGLLAAPVAASDTSCPCATRPIAVIPIVLVDGNNVAALAVGDVLLKTVIDTGGHREVGIAPAALRKLAVKFTGARTVRTDGGGARFAGREFVIQTMKLGGVQFLDIPGYERNESSGGDFGNAPFEALVGREFLSRYVVVIDYPYRRIELYPRDAGRNVCRRPVIELRQNSQGLWYSTFDIDGRLVKLAWDTGATHSFVKPGTLGDLPAIAEGAKTVALQFGRNRKKSVDFVELGLPGVHGLDGLLGFNFFESHRVCLDFKANAVSVQ